MKHWNKIITLNNGEYGEKIFETREDRRDFVKTFVFKDELPILPGEFNLDSRIHQARKEALKFEKSGYYGRLQGLYETLENREGYMPTWFINRW